MRAPRPRPRRAGGAALALGVVLVALSAVAVPIGAPASLAERCERCSLRPVAPPGAPIADYELGRASSLDPAVTPAGDPGAEPILNIYESLIAYNGSDPETYVPELSTCVPGSAACLAMYGSTLIANGSDGAPEFYTFPLDSGARFYDPATRASWPVYPSDVLFSLARIEGFADLLPQGAASPAGALASALLPAGNASWDGGVHAPYNSTPENVLASVLVNDSRFCPLAALAENGCVTLNALGAGPSVPQLLAVVANDLPASIVPCGWFTYVGAPVPGFNGSSARYGDGPCLLPGGATTTLSPAFSSAVNATSPTGWDAWEAQALDYPAVEPPVRWDAVGSGPYYLSSINATFGYGLTASPVYRAPSGCARSAGCEPEAGAYPASVNVFWGSSSAPALAAYASGTAQFADLDLPADTAALTALSADARVGFQAVPSPTVVFAAYSLNFSPALERAADPGGPLNVPSDFLDYGGLRQFLSLAFPYTLVNQSWLAGGGVPAGVTYAGAIPPTLGPYYPTNISWPLGRASSPNGSSASASYFWNQMHSAKSAIYDPELLACSAADPCRFPIVANLTGPLGLEIAGAWAASVGNLSAGALAPYVPPLSPSSNGTARWGGAYPIDAAAFGSPVADPAPYVAGLYGSSSPITVGTSLAATLLSPTFDSPGCSHASGSWSDLLYWASEPLIPTDCQGAAYRTLVTWIGLASAAPVEGERALLYNEVEQVANRLALYAYLYEEVSVRTYATPLPASTVTTNPMLVPSQAFYALGPASSNSTTRYRWTMTEAGLPAGTVWPITIDGTTYLANGTNFSLVVPNGTYPYRLADVAGFAPIAPTGVVELSGGPLALTAEYRATALSGTIVFGESGLPSGTNWSVRLDGTLHWAHGPLIAVTAPYGSYSYAVADSLVHWIALPANASLDLDAPSVLRSTVFAPTFPLAVLASGLPASVSWSLAGSGVVESNASAGAPPTYAFNLTSAASTLMLWLPNGTYQCAFTSLSTAWIAVHPSVVLTFTGGSTAELPVAFGVAFSVTFSEKGVPKGANWTLLFNGVNLTQSVGSVTLRVVNGTYNYTVSAHGLKASPAGGSLVVRGGNASVSVAFASSGAGHGLAKGGTFAFWVGTALAIVVLVLVVALVRFSPRQGERP